MTNNRFTRQTIFSKSGKSILWFVGVIAIISVVICAGFIFFTFTNTGVGIVQMARNVLKGDPSISSINEVVMPPNATIIATTDSGTITIKSGRGLKRYYTWDGATRSVVMMPRLARWYGSLGIYYPGSGSHWLPNHGITRGVVQEGQQHFETLEEAEAWLKDGPYLPCVYNDNGLVVCFGKTPAREQINVDVWQIFIVGKTPSQYQESTIVRQQMVLEPSSTGKGSTKISWRTLDEKELERIYGSRLKRIYTDGKKPIKLEGSNNSAIITSWDNSWPASK